MDREAIVRLYEHNAVRIMDTWLRNEFGTFSVGNSEAQ